MCSETIVSTPPPPSPRTKGGLIDFGKLPNRGVGKIKILGEGVTGTTGWYFQRGCSFSLITFFNNLRNWRNESVNFWLCSVQIFIHYHNNIVLKEQPLEVFLENRCSEKYVLKSSQVNLWSKYFKNTFEGTHFSCRPKAWNFSKKWTSSQVFF